MSQMPPMDEAIKQSIHFDTLLEQALEVIASHAAETWTDHGEHDPGMTLLQALCYNVSDLAYRHLLPLTDLLTVPGAETLFSEKFGARWALACSPVTMHDYRMGILDLGTEKNNEMLFRNVQVAPLDDESSECFRYYYQSSTRSFTFRSDGEYAEMGLLGDYEVNIEQWSSPYTGGQVELAVAYLHEHRNFGEGFPRVRKLEKSAYSPWIDIEIQDDLVDVHSVAVDFYWKVFDCWRPRPYWGRGDNQSKIYGPTQDGPWLMHGAMLAPPLRDYRFPHAVYGSWLVQASASISGIKRIIKMTYGGENVHFWKGTSREYTYDELWISNPEHAFTINNYIKFFKQGRRIELTSAELSAEFGRRGGFRMYRPVIPAPAVSAGRSRISLFFPFSIRLPACYGLQALEADAAQTELHQFQLPLEQWLANQCDRLSRLPSLLSFERDGNVQSDGILQGNAWPFRDDEPRHEGAQAVHAAYRAALGSINAAASTDTEKELDIINHLLGYFGAERAARTLIPEGDEDFLKVQRGYLRQITELDHDRARIQVNQVSALQRRIAGRLGWAPQLFEDNPPSLDKLPFYIIERRALLPARPIAAYHHALQVPAGLVRVEQDGVVEMTQATAGEELAVGMVLDFVIMEGETEKTAVGPLVVRSVSDRKIGFSTEDSQRLLVNVDRLMAAYDAGNLRWRNGLVWLYDMDHDIVKLEKASSSNTEKKCKITPSLYPPELVVGDKIAFVTEVKAAADGQRGGGVIQLQDVLVTAVDPLNGILTAEATNAADWDTLPADLKNCRWYIQRTKDNVVDHFSFVVSVVLPRGLLDDAGVVDKVDTAAWIEEIVREEMPAHVLPVMHWLDPQQYADFSLQYDKWQNGGQPLGDVSYRLLELLTIGQLRDRRGLGTRRIASLLQKETATAGGNWDQAYIDAEELLYVPNPKIAGNQGGA